MMNYLGRVLDRLTEIWDGMAASAHAAPSNPIPRALYRAMTAALMIERARANHDLLIQAIEDQDRAGPPKAEEGRKAA